MEKAMKRITGILLLALTLFLSVLLLAACGDGNGEAEGEGSGEGSGEQAGEYTSVSKEVWEAAFVFDNVTMTITENTYYGTMLYQSNSYKNFFADGGGYDEDGISQGSLSDYIMYFAFKDSYESFKHSSVTNEYTCASITVDDILYEDVVIKLTEDGRLASVAFSSNSSYFTFKITSVFTDHGVTVKPERAPFEVKGEEYCSYLETRELEGRALAYITIKVKDYGEIKLVLDATTAPITVNHFLRLVSEGFYDGLTFHRVIDEFMIQGGDPNANGTGDYKDKDGNKVTIKGEFSGNGYANDIDHIRGVISMARGQDNDSASCQFFICNAESDWLDGSYAAFGYVIDGMSVVDRITYDTMIFGDSNGTIADKTKQAVIESITIDELIGIELQDPDTDEGGTNDGDSEGSAESGGAEGDGEYTGVSEELWRAAFDFDNVTISFTEDAYYGTMLYQSNRFEFYFVDGEAYDEDGIPQGSIDAFRVYFAFKDSYDSFKHSSATDEYTCASITVDGLLYENVVIKFTEDGRLASVVFESPDTYFTYKITLIFTDHGETIKPERAPFEAQGEEYCSYLNTRDVEGHELAYITIKVKDYGEIKLVLDATTAPLTVKHILKLISEGFYDGLTFHRVIDEFMIQGGDPNADGTGCYKDESDEKVTVEGEFSENGHENDIQHLRGVISMARGQDNDSASCQFFICTVDCDWLDGKYATFGYVIDGMSVVDRITYDTMIFGDSNGTIADKTKQAVIESVTIDRLVGIELGE